MVGYSFYSKYTEQSRSPPQGRLYALSEWLCATSGPDPIAFLQGLLRREGGLKRG
jgi:hypothetical protein